MNGPSLRGLLHLSFGVKINFILGLGLALLVAVASLASRSVDLLVEAARYENDSFANLNRLEHLTGVLSRAESLARRYVITGAADDLARFKSARSDVQANSLGMDAAASDVVQEHRLRQLQGTLEDRLALLDEVVRARQSGAEAAAAIVRAGRGEEAALRVQILADQFRDYEQRTLRNRRNETEFSADAAAYVVSWGLAFAMALLVWAMVIIHRNQVAREKAESALKASEAQLRLITDAVPALIGYVGRDDKLQFHNRAFEYWFNRSPAQLREGTLRGLVGEQAYAVLAPQVDEVLAGRAAHFDLQLPAVGGVEMVVSMQLVPRREGEKGGVLGYYVLATDITALKEVDRLKSEFVATVSHELRTPLTSIRGSLGLLASGLTGALPDKARELVGIAVQNCERLIRLVNDILDSEKMLSGKMDWKIQELDLVELVRRSVREVEAYAAQHGATLALQAELEHLPVRADSDRMVQVVTNLLSNACKFSPQGGVVEVSVSLAGGMARVNVADRGPGVPRELQGRLFERFAQLDSNDGRRRAGTGLGLSICRAIIEHMAGSMGFSERAGGGSVFHFELPAAAVAAEKEVA